MTRPDQRRRYRAVFLSDVHLGTKGAKAAFLAHFLARMQCERLYLVGDIVDGWRLKRSWYWDDAHDEVLRLVMQHARNGTEIVYIPGNHDEMFRAWLGLEVAGVRLAPETVHEAADGRRYLVIHGDEFDGVVANARFLAAMGDRAYRCALVVNRWFNAIRYRMGYPYWSLSLWLKQSVKRAVKRVDKFEEALVLEARERGVDGVICGHIHKAEIRDVGGILYMNDGDWVESCTALVEQPDGSMELVHWAQENSLSFLRAGSLPETAPA